MNESDFAQTNLRKYEQMDCLLMLKAPEKFKFIRKGSKTASRQRRIWILGRTKERQAVDSKEGKGLMSLVSA